MLVALVALPVNAPLNVVAATDVKPAKVSDVAPSAMLVEPIVRELFVNAAFGILVNPAPLPANPVEVNIPVLGTNDNFVLETFCGKLPVLAVTQVGYTAEAVATSFVIPVLVAFVAVPVNAPTNVVDVTDVNPATVVVVDPRDMLVDPSVKELFVNAPLGMPVKFVPVNVGVVVNAGIALADPCNTPAEPATAAGTPVAPYVWTP